MNNKELQALRKLLMLDVAEAAEHIGNVSARSWHYWEAGRNPVPAAVAQKMLDLVAVRGFMAETLRPAAGVIELPYCLTFAEYADSPTTPAKNKNVLNWRIGQSVAAQFFAERLADLV